MCLAVAGELVSISEHPDPLWRSGDVRFGGVLRQVSLACVPEARVGAHGSGSSTVSATPTCTSS